MLPAKHIDHTPTIITVKPPASASIVTKNNSTNVEKVSSPGQPKVSNKINTSLMSLFLASEGQRMMAVFEKFQRQSGQHLTEDMISRKKLKFKIRSQRLGDDAEVYSNPRKLRQWFFTASSQLEDNDVAASDLVDGLIANMTDIVLRFALRWKKSDPKSAMAQDLEFYIRDTFCSSESTMWEYLLPFNLYQLRTVHEYYLEFTEAIGLLYVLLLDSVVSLLFLNGLRTDIKQIMCLRPPFDMPLLEMRRLAEETERLVGAARERHIQTQRASGSQRGVTKPRGSLERRRRNVPFNQNHQADDQSYAYN